jgi:hypothetical protein
MDPVRHSSQSEQFSVDYQRTVFNQSPNVNMIDHHTTPEKKFSLDSSKKKKGDGESKDKESKGKKEEGAPWFPS